MQRREFIKSSCSFCLGAIGMGLISQLSACAPMPVFKSDTVNETVQVPMNSFANGQLLIVRVKKMEYDILLVKQSESEVHALLMKCTHQDQPLTANRSGLFCASHGSTFDLNGKVTHEPALNPLKKYATSIDNSTISIYLNS